MLIMVITFNIALAVLCLGIALKLHRFKYSLRRATGWLTEAEQNAHFVLHSAPDYILLGQFGAQYGRRQMTGLSLLQRQFLHWAALLQLLQWIAQRPLRRSPKGLTARGKRR